MKTVFVTFNKQNLAEDPSLSTVIERSDCSKANILLQCSSMPGCSLLICNIAYVIIYFKCRRWKPSSDKHLPTSFCLLNAVTHWNSALPVNMQFKQTCLLWAVSLPQTLFNVTLKCDKELSMILMRAYTGSRKFVPTVRVKVAFIASAWERHLGESSILSPLWGSSLPAPYRCTTTAVSDA